MNEAQLKSDREQRRVCAVGASGLKYNPCSLYFSPHTRLQIKRRRRIIFGHDYRLGRVKFEFLYMKYVDCDNRGLMNPPTNTLLNF